MNFAQEQQQQQQYHERQRTQEGSTDSRRTLHASKPRTYDSSKPKKPTFPKGHDATLKAAQDLGEEIIVQPINGDPYTCTLLNRDRYTISVRLESGVKRVVYKHAIEYIDLPEGVEVVRHANSTSH